jgi:hypothetical protein
MLAETITMEEAEQSKQIDAIPAFYGMMIHAHYKPFHSFVSYEGFMAVCHGNTVSIFNSMTS